MSDLISRNEVNDVIDELEVYTSGRPNTTKVEISVLQLKRLINKLKNIPTTYDIDKVIEELKIIKEDALAEYNMGEYNLDNNIGNSISENYRKDMNEGKCFAYDEAIEIVKQGGDANNVCKWRLCDEELNVYDIRCRNPHILFKGTPKENNYKFCPYCGKKIKVVE